MHKHQNFDAQTSDFFFDFICFFKREEMVKISLKYYKLCST